MPTPSRAGVAGVGVHRYLPSTARTQATSRLPPQYAPVPRGVRLDSARMEPHDGHRTETRAQGCVRACTIDMPVCSARRRDAAVAACSVGTASICGKEATSKRSQWVKSSSSGARAARLHENERLRPMPQQHGHVFNHGDTCHAMKSGESAVRAPDDTGLACSSDEQYRRSD